MLVELSVVEQRYQAVSRGNSSFHRHALQGLLEHQFNTVEAIAGFVDLITIGSLEELAERLFA